MNAMVPTLSVVIPAYNEAESLPELTREIREVCDREKIAFEVIVIDDGSKDGTFDRVRELAAADPRVRGVQFRRNCGKAAALSEGFARSRGKYVDPGVYVWFLEVELVDGGREVYRGDVTVVR